MHMPSSTTTIQEDIIVHTSNSQKLKYIGGESE